MNELLRNHTIYDEEALIEYLNLISTPDDVGYIERHHILPRALFPQYAKDDWNIVTLSYDNQIKVKNSINKKNKVVVKDLEGNNLQVDVNDPRYLNGELIPINKGRVHDLDFSERNIKISEKRQERMRAYSVMSFDEMVEHIIKSFHDGKKIFTPSHRFERNYVTMIKQTNHDIELILQTVVQRLSKDSNG